MKKLSMDELNRLSVSSFKEADKIPVCILLDNIRSLHNVGSAFRTADAFRIEKIVLTGITGKPPHREIQKTALGATASVLWDYHENAIDAVTKLKEEGYDIVCVEQTSQSVVLQKFEFRPSKKYCVIFGNEVNGVSEELISRADSAIEIPQAGTKHSLNVSVCIGIVIWEMFQKLYLPE